MIHARMGMLQELRRRARYVVFPALGVSALAYFTYHAVQGERGLIAYLHLTGQIERAQTSLARVSAARRTLETDVALLQPGALDRDMLEERAHAVLGLARRDEVLILMPAFGKGESGARITPSLRIQKD